MKNESIIKFRDLLRKFEKELNAQIKSDYNCGVSVVQCHAVLALDNLGKCNLNQLATALQLDKSTVSRTVNGLVEKGMVVRTIPEEDRRTTTLVLSKKGKEVSSSINSGNDAYFKEVLKSIPSHSTECFLLGFEAVVHKMKELNATGFQQNG